MEIFNGSIRSNPDEIYDFDGGLNCKNFMPFKFKLISNLLIVLINVFILSRMDKVIDKRSFRRKRNFAYWEVPIGILCFWVIIDIIRIKIYS